MSDLTKLIAATAALSAIYANKDSCLDDIDMAESTLDIELIKAGVMDADDYVDSISPTPAGLLVYTSTTEIVIDTTTKTVATRKLDFIN